jgi:hypothetical protein
MSVINKDTGAFYKKIEKDHAAHKGLYILYVCLFIEVCFKDLRA